MYTVWFVGGKHARDFKPQSLKMRRENQTPQRVPKNTYSPVDFRQGSDRRARYEKDPCMHQVECIAGWPPSPPPERWGEMIMRSAIGFRELLAGWLRGRGPRRRVWSSLNLNLWTDKSSQRPASFQPLIIHGLEREREREGVSLGPFKSVLVLSLPPLLSFASLVCFLPRFFFKLPLWNYAV